jgi:hypothetical protein
MTMRDYFQLGLIIIINAIILPSLVEPPRDLASSYGCRGWAVDPAPKNVREDGGETTTTRVINFESCCCTALIRGQMQIIMMIVMMVVYMISMAAFSSANWGS